MLRNIANIKPDMIDIGSLKMTKCNVNVKKKKKKNLN